MANKKLTGFTLDADVLAALDIRAKKESRSRSSTVNLILKGVLLSE